MKKVAVLAMMAFACAGAFAVEGMRTRYALSINGTAVAVAQFVPGDSYLVAGIHGGSNIWYDDSEENKRFKQPISEEVAPYINLYRRYRYGQEKTVADGGLQVRLPNLSSEVSYMVRIHTIEFWNSSAGKRGFSVYVNGESMNDGAVYDVCRDLGKSVPGFYDFEGCTAAADGTMNVFLKNYMDKLVVCGIEVFEPTNAPAYRPAPQIKGFEEFAYIDLNTAGHMARDVFYDVQYRDGGAGGEVKFFATGVRGSAMYDTTPAAVAANREYRVRIAGAGEDLWSDWISAGRTTSAVSDAEGQKLLPVAAAEWTQTGAVSVFHKNASDTDASATNEAAVAETVLKDSLAWTQVDVPQSCAGAPVRVLTAGRLFFPYAVENCRVVVRGAGLVNLWLDGGRMKTSLLNGGAVTNAFVYSKVVGNLSVETKTNECRSAAGMMDFYVEQLQPAEVDLATGIEFLDGSGNAIPVRVSPSVVTAETSPWKYHQLHLRGHHYQADAYALPLDEVRTAFRMYGSGNSTWGATDGGSFLYQTVKGPFELKMRINSIGELYDADCRFGIGMRGGLGTTAADKFLVVAGYNPRSGVRPMVFWDEDLSNGMNISAPFVGSYGAYGYPVWLRLVNSPGVDGEGRKFFNFEFSFSRDGENWDRFASTNVLRSSSVCVGPIVVASSKLGVHTPWMDIDNLELINNEKRPLVLIIR